MPLHPVLLLVLNGRSSTQIKLLARIWCSTPEIGPIWALRTAVLLLREFFFYRL